MSGTALENIQFIAFGFRRVVERVTAGRRASRDQWERAQLPKIVISRKAKKETLRLVFEMYNRGEKMTKIARDLQLSPERIRQMLREARGLNERGFLYSD